MRKQHGKNTKKSDITSAEQKKERRQDKKKLRREREKKEKRTGEHPKIRIKTKRKKEIATRAKKKRYWKEKDASNEKTQTQTLCMYYVLVC